MKRYVDAVIFGCLFAVSPVFAADNFPSRSVRFIVPFPPGGGTDAFARVVGGKLTEIWGQQVVIDNRGGAQGNIGTAMAAKSNADGYTILLAHQGALVINPHIYSNPGFNTLRDFAAVTRGTAMASVVVVHPSVPAKSMKELAQYAKQNPGKLVFASTASGQQLLGEMFKTAASIDMVHVPYKGAGPAMTDLLGGNVSVMFANPTSTVPQVKAGRLRALGVLGTRRNDALPDVPTAVEAGFPELSDVLEWYGVVAPAGTPKDIIEKLNAATVRALAAPDVASRLQGMGQTPSASTSAEFAQQIRREYERWGKVVKQAGIKVD